MITLDYYDDNTVRDNAVFFTLNKIFAIVIASYLSIGFSIYKLYKFELEGNTQTAQIAFFVSILAISFMTVFICMMLYFNRRDNELYSRNDLMKLKRNYESEREKVLKEHSYNYSIFTIYWDTIDKEIFCDTFSVDNNGYVYIMNSDSDAVLDESENNKEKYHHIVDNRDGHTLTVKELKEKYLSENINGKSQKEGN
ncbi:MAG: hypothetical protein K6C98_02730 [Treponema sp.]|nr:hypothetical protein [Treponema sp.]